MQTVTNALRVLHYPQIPCKPFVVEVKNEAEAHLVAETLANQHLFLFENGFIDDYSNVICVQMWGDIDGDGDLGWMDYYNEDEMMEWDEFVETYFL